jgi:hypothetical protein
LQIGGKGIVKDPKFDYGNFLLLESPRFMHPPLDIILSIDFIIHNFYSEKKRSDLVNERTYKKAISNAKRYFWRPYALALVSHCDVDFQRDFRDIIIKDFQDGINGCY